MPSIPSPRRIFDAIIRGVIGTPMMLVSWQGWLIVTAGAVVAVIYQVSTGTPITATLLNSFLFGFFVLFASMVAIDFMD